MYIYARESKTSTLCIHRFTWMKAQFLRKERDRRACMHEHGILFDFANKIL